MPIQFHLNTPNHVLVLIKPGKPNPKLPVQIVGPEDNRERVAMKPGYYPYTWRYAQKLLSTDVGLIGDNVMPGMKADLLERRKVEQVLSSLRRENHKIQVEYNEAHKNIILGKHLADLKDKEVLRINIDDIDIDEYSKQKNELDKAHAVKNIVALLKTIKALGLSEAFSDFKKDLAQRILDIDSSKAKPSDFEDKEAYETFCSKINARVDTMMSDSNRQIANAFLFYQTSKKLKLQESTWTPEMSIDEVIALIKEQGPFYVNSLMNCKSAKISHDLCSRINDYQLKNIQETHDVQEKCTSVFVVIGARNDRKGQKIYFINPADGSTPQDVKKQTIYSVDFKPFVSSVVDISNILLKTTSGEKLAAGFAYAMYQPLYQHVQNQASSSELLPSRDIEDDRHCKTEDGSVKSEDEDWWGNTVDYQEDVRPNCPTL